MKNRRIVLLVFIWLVALQTLFALPANQFYSAKVAALFSPKGGCTDAIVNEINKAETSVWVQTYYFTSRPIGEALAKARGRRIDVYVIADKTTVNNQRSMLPFLDEAGAKIWIDDKEAIAHNKVIIVDGLTVFSGSFNFTEGAEERNAENLLIIKDAPEIVWQYTNNIKTHLKHSIPLKQWEEEHKP